MSPLFQVKVVSKAEAQDKPFDGPTSTGYLVKESQDSIKGHQDESKVEVYEPCREASDNFSGEMKASKAWILKYMQDRQQDDDSDGEVRDRQQGDDSDGEVRDFLPVSPSPGPRGLHSAGLHLTLCLCLSCSLSLF